MKKSLFFSIVLFNIAAFGYTQNFSLNLGKVTLYEGFEKIKKEGNVTMFYSDDELDVSKLVQVKYKSKSALEMVTDLVGPNFEVKLLDNSVLVISPVVKKNIVIEKQNLIVINGKVTDETGKSMPGVNVKIKGTNIVTQTGFDGSYTISAPIDGTLLFTYVGYTSETVAVNGKKEINMTLKQMQKDLGEVVVKTGIVERKKATFTGAISITTGAQLKAIGNQNVIQSLKTLDPSFVVIDNQISGSNPNRLPIIEVRGKTSVSQKELKSKFGGDPNQPLFILDGFETDLQTIVDLDMNRVASITVLKDASSASLYGARAANGVVVIETIRPKAGQLFVSYNNDTRFEGADLSVYNLMNAEQKLEFEKLSGMYVSIDPSKQAKYDQLYNDRLTSVRRGVNTYWLKEPTQLGVTSGNTLSIGGGSEEFKYGLGINYKSQDGVMKGSGRDTWGFNVDLNYRKNKVNITNKIFINGYDAKESPYGSFATWANANPYYEKYNKDGSLSRYLGGFNTIPVGEGAADYLGAQANPLFTASLGNYDKTKNFSFRDNIQGIYSFNDNLKGQVGLQVVKGHTTQEIFVSPESTTFIDKAFNEKGSYQNIKKEYYSWDTNLMLTYAREFGEKHQFSSSVRAEAQETNDEYNAYDLVGFPLGVGGNPAFAFGYKPNSKAVFGSKVFRRNSLLSSTNYVYDRRFLFDFTYRIDGSTAFGSNERFTPFWGAGVGWNLNNEFKMNRNIVNEFKLRANIGITGNQSFGSFASNDIYEYNLDYNNFGQGSELVQLGNPDLKWPKTKDLSVGIDFAMFQNRFTATLNAYEKKTDPLVVAIDLPSSAGVKTYPLNTGFLDTKGVEAILKFSPIYNLQKNIFWTLGLTGSLVKSEYGGFDNSLASLNEAEKKSNSLVRYRDGYSPDDIWAVRSLGIDPATGKEVFLKENGQSTFNYDAKDIVKVGNTRPKVEGVISTNLNIKNFSFGVYMRYRYGGDVFNTALYNKVENITGDGVWNNQDVRALNERWQNPGDVTQFKGISIITIPAGMSSRFVQSENTIIGESINFGYTVTNQAWLKSAGLVGLRASAYANDIFYQSTVKAERGIEYPFSRAFSFSINATF